MEIPQHLIDNYLTYFEEYMSWINDPDSHMETYREPGAGYFRECERQYHFWETAFKEAAGIKSNDWAAIRKKAYELSGK